MDQIQSSHLGCEIFITNNRDAYRGGFEWSACRDGVEVASGLAFSSEDALQEAQRAAALDCEYTPRQQGN